MSYIRETLALHSITPDLIPADAPLEAWSDGFNVAFRNGETIAARADLATTMFPTIGTIRACVYVEPDNTGYWVAAGTGKIMASDGTVEYDITPAGWGAATADDVFTATVINGLAVINASGEDPFYWDGNPASVCQPLPGWPSGGRCIAMRAHKNFLFAIGMLSEGGQRVRWSDAAPAGVIPSTWAPAADNLAGFVDLAPLMSECVDGKTMLDDFLIYKRHSIHRATFVGGNDVFAFSKLRHKAGCAAPNAICEGPENDEHLFIGSDGDVHITDGVQVRSVLDGRAQRTFYSSFQDPKRGVYSAATLRREKLGIIGFPTSDKTKQDNALLFDFASGDISFRELPGVLCMAEGRMLEDVGDRNFWNGHPETWNSNQESWNQEITAQSVDDVLMGGGSFWLFNGTDQALDVRLEKSGLAFGNPQARKLVWRIWPKVEGVEGDVIRFRVGGQNAHGDGVDLGAQQSFVIGSGASIPVSASGRFISLLVESSGTAGWKMGSIDVEFRELGQW